MALLNHRRTVAGRTGPVSDKPVVDGPAPVEMQNQAQQPADPQQAYRQPPQDSPYENQQSYPVEQPQQAYAVPENREPHQQV